MDKEKRHTQAKGDTDQPKLISPSTRKDNATIPTQTHPKNEKRTKPKPPRQNRTPSMGSAQSKRNAFFLKQKVDEGMAFKERVFVV